MYIIGYNAVRVSYCCIGSHMLTLYRLVKHAGACFLCSYCSPIRSCFSIHLKYWLLCFIHPPLSFGHPFFFIFFHVQCHGLWDEDDPKEKKEPPSRQSESEDEGRDKEESEKSEPASSVIGERRGSIQTLRSINFGTSIDSGHVQLHYQQQQTYQRRKSSSGGSHISHRSLHSSSRSKRGADLFYVAFFLLVNVCSGFLVDVKFRVTHFVIFIISTVPLCSLLCVSDRHGWFATWNVNCFHRKYHFPQQQPQGRQRGQRPSEDPQTDDNGETEGAVLQRQSFPPKAVRRTTVGLLASGQISF